MRKLDSKTRGCTYSRKDGNARANSLLHQLETGAAAHEKNSVADRKVSSKPLGADNFVYRIVPPDILPHEAKITSAIKQRRRMKSARPSKNLLGAAKLFRHPMDYLCADSEPLFPSHYPKRHASDCLK